MVFSASLVMNGKLDIVFRFGVVRIQARVLWKRFDNSSLEVRGSNTSFQ